MRWVVPYKDRGGVPSMAVWRGKPKPGRHDQLLTEVLIASEGAPPFRCSVPIEFRRGWFRIQVEYRGSTNEFAFHVNQMNLWLWWLMFPLIAWASLALFGTIRITHREVRTRREGMGDTLVVEPRWPNDVIFEITFASSATATVLANGVRG